MFNRSKRCRTSATLLGFCYFATLLLSGCGPQTDNEAEAEPSQDVDEQSVVSLAPDLQVDDVAFLTQLSLIQGHLLAGYELYRQDLPSLAETHMKHPGEEIYSGLMPAFATRGCQDFGSDLIALSNAVEDRQTMADFNRIFTGLDANIEACSAVVDQRQETVLAVIRNLLVTADEEYAIGIVDGTLVNLHEYQDAWGFVQIANRWTHARVFAKNQASTAMAEAVRTAIESLESLFPSLNPNDVSKLSNERFADVVAVVDGFANQ